MVSSASNSTYLLKASMPSMDRTVFFDATRAVTPNMFLAQKMARWTGALRSARCPPLEGMLSVIYTPRMGFYDSEDSDRARAVHENYCSL